MYENVSMLRLQAKINGLHIHVFVCVCVSVCAILMMTDLDMYVIESSPSLPSIMGIHRALRRKTHTPHKSNYAHTGTQHYITDLFTQRS